VCTHRCGKERRKILNAKAHRVARVSARTRRGTETSAHPERITRARIARARISTLGAKHARVTRRASVPRSGRHAPRARFCVQRGMSRKGRVRSRRTATHDDDPRLVNNEPHSELIVSDRIRLLMRDRRLHD